MQKEERHDCARCDSDLGGWVLNIGILWTIGIVVLIIGVKIMLIRRVLLIFDCAVGRIATCLGWRDADS